MTHVACATSSSFFCLFARLSRVDAPVVSHNCMYVLSICAENRQHMSTLQRKKHDARNNSASSTLGEGRAMMTDELISFFFFSTF